MNRICRYTKFLSITALFLIYGCSGTISTISMSGQTPRMFPMSQESAEKIVASAMASEFAGNPISRVEFPNKGYQVTYRFALDSHTVVAYMIAAKGKDTEGRVLEGYVFEVSHSGTMPISGSHHTNNIFNKIIQAAQTISKTLPLVGY